MMPGWVKTECKSGSNLLDNQHQATFSEIRYNIFFGITWASNAFVLQMRNLRIPTSAGILKMLVGGAVPKPLRTTLRVGYAPYRCFHFARINMVCSSADSIGIYYSDVPGSAVSSAATICSASSTSRSSVSKIQAYVPQHSAKRGELLMSIVSINISSNWLGSEIKNKI